MKIRLNGREIEIDEGITIESFLLSRKIDLKMVAVEHNLKLVDRKDLPNIILQENDRLEVVRIVAGG